MTEGEQGSDRKQKRDDPDYNSKSNSDPRFDRLVKRGLEGELSIDDVYNEMFGTGGADGGEGENWDNSSYVPGPDLDERDRLIVKYNNQGLSSRKIAKSLHDFHDIKVTPRLVSRHLRDIGNLYKGTVKVNYQGNSKSKDLFRWYHIVKRLQTEIPLYTSKMGFKPSSRTMGYHLQDLKLITPKDMSNRICSECGKKETSIDKRRNRPMWYRTKQPGAWRCVICYNRANESVNRKAMDAVKQTIDEDQSDRFHYLNKFASGKVKKGLAAGNITFNEAYNIVKNE